MADKQSTIETDAIVIGAGPVGLYQVFQLGLLGIKAHLIDALPQAGGQCVELYADKPIYELIEGEGDKKSVTPIFAVTEVLEKVLEIGRRGMQIKRFKGLGEMNAKELFETTMDPTKRQFLRVRLDEDNAVEADKMFDVLMGDIVEPRKRFIEDNALNVRNLDV